MSAEREFWEEFLNMYKLYPCLWNSKSKDYSNRQLRETATADLVTKCKERYPNADRNFVTKKIHSFRSAFRQELKKVITSLKSGASSDDIYVPSLWYYYTLSFIADSEMPREAKSNLNEDSLLEERAESEDLDDESEQALSNIETVESPLESPTSPPIESSGSSSAAKRPRYPQTLKRYGRSKGLDGTAEVNQTRNETLNSLSDFDIAGLKYARDLASLDPVQRNLLEKIVADAIFYGKQGKLTEHSSFQVAMHSTGISYSQQYPPSTIMQPLQFPNISHTLNRNINITDDNASYGRDAHHSNTTARNENMNIMSEFLHFK